jgi:steroid 5-alpha reductase family enzyme
MILLYELVSFIFIWSLLGFSISRIARRNDIADLLWPLGFLIISLLQIDLGPRTDLRSIIVFSFVCFWSLRLTSLFIFRLS